VAAGAKVVDTVLMPDAQVAEGAVVTRALVANGVKIGKGAVVGSADSENILQTYAAEYAIEVDANEFTRPNHSFIGWSYSPDGTVDIHAGDSITFAGSGSVTLYALWAEDDKYSYSLTYNGNGGALADGTLSYGDSENITETYDTEASLEAGCTESCDNFIDGFRLGARMMMDVLADSHS
jgi:NDP-sugar pyrophosphorylase family protein